jgi:hypothetical protein
MTEINMWSFFSVFFFQMLGALAHFRKLKNTKRVRGSYFDYLFSDSPDKSAATVLLLAGSAWFSCTSGNGDLLNPELLWNLIKSGILHVPSVNMLLTALMAGYTFDSISNKGTS